MRGSTFFLFVGAERRSVEWERVSLVSTQELEHVIFVDACMIYHCVANLSARIPSLTRDRSATATRARLLAFAEELARLDSAQQLLVSGAEIAVLEDYYTHWKLNDMVRSTRDQLGAVASAASLAASVEEGRRSFRLNLLLTVLALAGLYQARELWAPLATDLKSSESASRVLIGTAVALFLGALGVSFAREWIARWNDFTNQANRAAGLSRRFRPL